MTSRITSLTRTVRWYGRALPMPPRRDELRALLLFAGIPPFCLTGPPISTRQGRGHHGRYIAPMATESIAEARKDLEKEYADVRKHFGGIEAALRTVLNSNAEDDIEHLLGELEDTVKKARTGGVLGSGANAHARARKHYLELSGKN